MNRLQLEIPGGWYVGDEDGTPVVVEIEPHAIDGHHIIHVDVPNRGMVTLDWADLDVLLTLTKEYEELVE